MTGRGVGNPFSQLTLLAECGECGSGNGNRCNYAEQCVCVCVNAG